MNVAYASPSCQVVSLTLAHPEGAFPVLVVDTRTAQREVEDTPTHLDPPTFAWTKQGMKVREAVRRFSENLEDDY